MSRLTRALPALAVLPLLLAGCGNVTESLTERAVEEVVERSLGSEAAFDVDTETGEVDISVGDTSISTSGEIPESVRELIWLPEDHEVLQVTAVDGGTRGAVFTVTTAADVPTAIDQAREGFLALGWTVAQEATSADGALLILQGPGDVTVTIGSEGEQTTLNYLVSLGQDGGAAGGEVAGDGAGSAPAQGSLAGGAPGGSDAVVEATDVAWSTSATTYRGQDGTRVAFDCPAGGDPSAVWGSDPYTDDSSVCGAAVHAGLITLAEGGRVVIEIAPGEESYPSSEANGLTTSDWPSYPGSFTFPPR